MRFDTPFGVLFLVLYSKTEPVTHFGTFFDEDNSFCRNLNLVIWTLSLEIRN
jgi:hypothetical protein